MLCGHPKGQTKMCALILQKDLTHSRIPGTEVHELHKQIEVNQTKPEQAAEGGEICADSAGYAPQALVPLYDVN